MTHIANNNATPHLVRVCTIAVRIEPKVWIDPAEVFGDGRVQTTNEFDRWYHPYLSRARASRWSEYETHDIFALSRKFREATFERELPRKFMDPVKLATLILYELEYTSSRNRHLVHPNETIFYASSIEAIVLEWKPRQHKLKLDLQPRAANRSIPKDTYIGIPHVG